MQLLFLCDLKIMMWTQVTEGNIKKLLPFGLDTSVILGWLLGHFRVILQFCRSRFGIALESFWSRAVVGLESFGVILECGTLFKDLGYSQTEKETKFSAAQC